MAVSCSVNAVRFFPPPTLRKDALDIGAYKLDETIKIGPTLERNVHVKAQ